MRFCEAGPYNMGQKIVTVGGGLKTSQLLYGLKYFYMGGVRVNKDITDERFPAGDGPARLVACMVHSFSSTGGGRRTNSAVIPPFGDLLTEMARSETEFASWETALKWFMFDSLVCQQFEMIILWVSRDRGGGDVEIAWVGPGSEAPMVGLCKWSKSKPLPDKALFFTERPILTEPD